MSKRILLLSTSPRKGGNAEALADEFLRGVKDVGYQADKGCLVNETIGFCTGCLVCSISHRCVISNGALRIAQKKRTAQVLVFATPTYFFEMCGQMKTMLGRSNPLYGSDYSFRDIYLLATASEQGNDVPHRAENGLQGWMVCFPNAHPAGSVFAGGMRQGQLRGILAVSAGKEVGNETVYSGGFRPAAMSIRL